MSCDLLDTETPGLHYKGDVTQILNAGWDLMIAHPPCTHLAVSGSRWFKDKVSEQAEALTFVRLLMDAPIPCIVIENPVSIISSKIRLTRSSNHGSSGTVRPRLPVCGSRVCRS